MLRWQALLMQVWSEELSHTVTGDCELPVGKRQVYLSLYSTCLQPSVLTVSSTCSVSKWNTVPSCTFIALVWFSCKIYMFLWIIQYYLREKERWNYKREQNLMIKLLTPWTVTCLHLCEHLESSAETQHSEATWPWGSRRGAAQETPVYLL